MRRTRVGYYGRSGDFTAFSRDQLRSILAGQHDHPVLVIPAGVQSDYTDQEVSVVSHSAVTHH